MEVIPCRQSHFKDSYYGDNFSISTELLLLISIKSKATQFANK